jgi:hypothetical protein
VLQGRRKIMIKIMAAATWNVRKMAARSMTVTRWIPRRMTIRIYNDGNET